MKRLPASRKMNNLTGLLLVPEPVCQSAQEIRPTCQVLPTCKIFSNPIGFSDTFRFNYFRQKIAVRDYQVFTAFEFNICSGKFPEQYGVAG